MSMKRLLVCVGSLVLVALIALPGSAAARASRIAFEGNDVPTGPPIDWGDWNTLPSGNVHVRGMTSVYTTTMYQEPPSDWRVSGLNTVVMNANWGPDYAGPMWGTSENVLFDSEFCPGGGVWQGTWRGVQSADSSYTYLAVAKGVSGCVEGMHLSLTAFNPGNNALTTYSGEILDPHGE